jgi:hypothetical protein
MRIVPASRNNARRTRTENAPFVAGLSALPVVGSSSGQLQGFYLPSPISSSNLAPAAAPPNVVPPPVVPTHDAATSGRSTALLLAETHEASGLTWEQIARYFGVSRRAVHLWTSGGRMTASNEELLAHLVRAVEAVKHLAPLDRRQELLRSGSGLNLVDVERARRSSRESDINRSPRIGVVADQA